MSRAIWKFPLTEPRVLLQVPDAGFMEPGIVRAVAWQQGNPTLWIEVDPDWKEPRPRRFDVVATGQPFEASEDAVYVGSAISDSLVFHVYEILSRRVPESEER